MEKLFSYVWKTQTEKNKSQIGYAQLEDYLTQFEMFTKMSSPFKDDNDIGGSLWSVGYVDSNLFLPKDLCWTPNTELNMRLVQLLILNSIAIKFLNIIYVFHDRARIAPRIFSLSQFGQINIWLDSQFPYFSDFQKKTLDAFESYFTNLRSNQIKKNDPLYLYWKKQIQSRSPATSDSDKLELGLLLKKQKGNDEPPAFLHATTPLPFRRQNITSDNSDSKKNTINEQDKDMTQKKRNQKEFSESIDLKKQGAVNPTLHSFEKMETADDYDGGRRVESGDDELNNHEKAMDELELNRHTSAGEASSLYRQDSSQFKLQQLIDPTSETVQVFQYPEWNERENRYIKSFCTVYPTIPDENTESEDLKEQTRIQYQSLILKWKNKMNALVNTPMWQNRLLDGADIDLESLIRFLPELKTYSGRPRIYAEKRKSHKDISVLILADVSYSTDTWINGKKVIDIIRESLAVASFIFEDVFDSVSVAITNSETRKKINYTELKKFDEGWIRFFRRSHELIPHQYTRLGPAIRHASKVLSKENTIKPILILITDGKPTDLDPYEGSHGQKDVKKALAEAKNMGIHILPLTISDFDPASLKKIFDRPCSIENPDDFCREVFQFVWKTCLKNI